MKVTSYATLDGRDVTGRTIIGARIRHGRDRVSEQPDPASATLELVVVPGDEPSPVTIGSTLDIGVVLPSGERAPRFSGTVTDLTVDLSSGMRVRQLVAVSDALGRMARRTIGDEPWPEEPVGVRIVRCATLAGVTATVAGDDTITTFGADVDRQGALTLAQAYADTGGAVLAEDPSTPGAFTVHTSEYRRTPGPGVNIPSNVVEVGAQAEQRIETLTNRARVRWGATDPQAEVLVQDLPSIDRWGEYEVSVSTTLATVGDATERAARLVALGRTPGWQFTGLVIDLALPTVSDDLAADVLALRVGGRVNLTGVDTEAAPASYVEGWEDELLGVTGWRVSLNVSESSLTTPAPRWVDVDPATRWVDLDPALTWIGAAVGPLETR